MFGERCRVGEDGQEDSYFVFSKDLHYILIHYLNFKNWNVFLCIISAIKN